MDSSASHGSPASTAAAAEAVRLEVADWDDEVVARARFKAFCGQKSDWEPKFLFWRDLILKVARRLGVCAVRSAEMKNVWFSRGGLTPLCMDQVLHEMHINGDILLKGDLIDPTSGNLYRMLRRLGLMVGVLRSLPLQDNLDNLLIIKPLVQEKAADIVKILNESHWTSACVITIDKFQSFFKGDYEASSVLSYLCQCGKARHLSIRKEDFIEGVKLSLVEGPVPSTSNMDYDLLHLIWVAEKLEQQLDVIDRRWNSSRKMALASFKSENKQAAYRQIRQSKLFLESRVKCTSLLEKVEEVLRLIANTESTTKVSEAIQIGTRAIKEHGIGLEEVQLRLKELDEVVAADQQIESVLGTMPLQYADIQDEDVEEEFEELENELKDEIPRTQMHELLVPPMKEAASQDFELLSQSLSNLSMEAA